MDTPSPEHTESREPHRRAVIRTLLAATVLPACIPNGSPESSRSDSSRGVRSVEPHLPPRHNPPFPFQPIISLRADKEMSAAQMLEAIGIKVIRPTREQAAAMLGNESGNVAFMVGATISGEPLPYTGYEFVRGDTGRFVSIDEPIAPGTQITLHGTHQPHDRTSVFSHVG